MRLMRLIMVVLVVLVVLVSGCTTVNVTLTCGGDINLQVDGSLEYPICEEW